MTEKTVSRLFRVREVAEQLALSQSKIRLMIQSGELPSVKIGKAVRVPDEALEKWMGFLTGHDSQ